MTLGQVRIQPRSLFGQGQVKVNQLPAVSFNPLDSALEGGALGDAEGVLRIYVAGNHPPWCRSRKSCGDTTHATKSFKVGAQGIA